MLKWIATTFQRRRVNLQSRLGKAAGGASAAVTSQEWRTRGNAHLGTGNLEEAAACYQRGLICNPQDAICYSNLGYVLRELGRVAESQEMLLKAVELNPMDFDAQHMLGNLARSRGESLQAIVHFGAAMRVNAGFDACRRDLCLSLAETGQFREARSVLDGGLAFTPHSVDFYFIKGTLHFACEEFDDAIANFQMAARLRPGDLAILTNLGAAQIKRGQVLLAIETYHGVLGLDPTNLQALANLAVALKQSGQLSLAIQTYRKVLQLDSGRLDARQGLVSALTQMPGLPPSEYLFEARQYGAAVSARAKPYSQWCCPAHVVQGRPLRVGFVSGDLRAHPVGFFIENVLARIDAANFALVAYSTAMTEDVLSERLKSIFSEWHSVATIPDEALAKKIHADKIDILVDMAGHTGLNRLAVFAWKPAPVQVSWLGYWASTGVAEIDYILVDPVSVPASDAQFFSEKLWHLPHTRLCMSPPHTTRAIEVNALPALSNGHVTFGSYQMLSKISDRTLAAWSQVLARIPSARLRLQSKPLSYPEAILNVQQRLAQFDIDVARVDLYGETSREDYLASYGTVDVILDTFPFPGGTTTAEALWMGVPTVTVGGNSLLARQGESLMRCVGLGEWVAANEWEYVELAIALVSDLRELDELRAGLRSRALASPLFDATKFAQDLEVAFSEMMRANRRAYPE
jgi:protein O-GlcNAc transferase